MPENNERSAEFCRGAVAMARTLGDSLGEEQYRALLAAAEAREGTQPTAAEVVEAAERALKDERSPLRLCEPSCQKESVSRCMCRHCTSDRTTAALALCARWKEANGA